MEVGDCRDQLASWKEDDRDVAGYAEQAGILVDCRAVAAVPKLSPPRRPAPPIKLCL